ncbi:MAG: zinc-dependent alcohol dehydrogenase [Aestuariivirgaceae bacterium]
MSPTPARTMQGAVLTGPKTIEIRDVPVPEPGPGEILVRIRAATTCGTDVKVYLRGGHPRMLKVPTLFGHEMAGEVSVAGDGVTSFPLGDRVVVANSAPCLTCQPCRMGRENLCEDLQYLNGAFAEYLLVPARFVERNTHVIPEGLSFARAAITEPLACVLHGIEACEFARYASDDGPVEAIIYGAGPIGLLFVAALAFAGHHVIVADPNPARLETAAALGATRTVRITRGGGQADTVRQATAGGKGAWIAVDATGVPEVWADAMASIRPGGLVNLFGGCAPGTTVALDTHLVHYSELTIKGVYHHRPATIKKALQLLGDPAFKADLLISGTRPVSEVQDALESMIAKQSLKLVIKNDGP